MGFTITSSDVAFDPATQSVWYDTDLAILAAAMNGEGVVSGCGVSAQGSPDMTLAVAAGVIRIASGVLVTVASGNVTVGAASGTHPRIDLISSSNAGVKTVTAGTAAASPKPPALPAGHIALAYVLIPTSDTTLEANHLVDKRCILGGGYTGPAWGQGTAFPGSPVAGQLFRRTDIDAGVDCVFDGTRWVSAQPIREIFVGEPVIPVAATATIGRWFWDGTYDVWIEAIEIVTYHQSPTGTNFWDIQGIKGTAAESETNIGSDAVTSSDTSLNWTFHNQAIGALLGTTYRYIRLAATKHASATNLYSHGRVRYRIVYT